MATAKTTIKTQTSKSKPSTMLKSKVNKESSIQMKDKNSKKITLAALKQNVFDPKNRKSLIISILIIVIALAAFFGRSLLIAAVVNGQPISRISVIK